MQIKFNKVLTVVLSSAMTFSLILFNTPKVKGQNTPSVTFCGPVAIRTNWHLSDSVDAKATVSNPNLQYTSRKELVEELICGHNDGLIELGGYSNYQKGNIDPTRVIFTDEFGVFVGQGGEITKITYGDRTVEKTQNGYDNGMQMDYIEGAEFNIYVKPQPIVKSFGKGPQDPYLYGRYENTLSNNHELQPLPETIEIKPNELVTKDTVNKILSNEFKVKLGTILYDDIKNVFTLFKETNKAYILKTNSDQNYAEFISNNLNYTFEYVNLFDKDQNNGRFQVWLYDLDTKSYLTGNDGNRLNLLDEGAFNFVKSKKYKLVISVAYEDYGVALTKGNENLRTRYPLQSNIVFDINFNFSEAKKSVSYTEPTMPMAHTIHVTLHDGDEVIKQVQINAGDKLLPSLVPTPVKEGYEFLGWYYKASDEYKLGPRGLEDELLPFNFDRSIYTDFDLYAKWKKVEVEEKRPVPNTADC